MNISQLPEISICIPTYNQTKYLVKTLDSLFNQTFENFEIIISDDSITDHVYELVLLFQQKFNDKIIYFRNNPSLGSPQNWNNVILKAKGKWIKIMHHDDWFCQKDALDKLVSVVIQNPKALVFGGIQGNLIGDNRSYINLPSQHQIDAIKKDPFSLIWANIIGPPSTIIFPKTEVEFDSRLLWLVDIEFYLQLLMNHKLELVYVEEVLLENQPDDHNITNQCFQNKQLELKEFNLIFNKYFPKGTFKQRYKFLCRLKTHISTYAGINFFELIYAHLKYK